MPEGPKQEAAFLPFPKAGNHVFHRQLVGAMAPHVVKAVVVGVNEVKKCSYDAEHTDQVHHPRGNADAPPTFAP